MNRYVKAALWAIPPIFFLVIVPTYILGLISASQLGSLKTSTGIDLALVVDELAVFGIVLAVLSALQTWAEDWSVVKFTASSLHMITSYVLLLFLLGTGDPWTFGTGTFTLSSASTGEAVGSASVSVVVVSTFIAVALGVAVALKITQRAMKYSEAKKIRRRDSIGAGALWCPKCGAENAMNAKFCEKCGAPLQASLSPAGNQTWVGPK